MRRAVKDLFIADLQAFLAAQIPPIPFYQTINERQTPRDDLYVTCEFFTNFIEQQCMSGGKRMEEGTVDVLVYGRAGQGYTAVNKLTDAIEDYFHGRDIASNFQIIGTEGSGEFTLGDAAPHYGMQLSFTYQIYL